MTVRELIKTLVEYPMGAQVRIYHELAPNIIINCDPHIDENDCTNYDCVSILFDFPSNNFVVRRKTNEELKMTED